MSDSNPIFSRLDLRVRKEKIIQILIGHLEGEAAAKREEKIQSNIKKLTGANEEDIKTAKR